MEAKPITDLTAKRVPSAIPWGKTQQDALDKLKELLCKAAVDSLYVVDFHKPFHIHVDASDYAVGASVSQTGDKCTKWPIAFASQKLNTQCSTWMVYYSKRFVCGYVGLAKYRKWLFTADIVIFCDHNPITYSSETCPRVQN